MRRIFRSMSYANIAATLALFLAVGGGGAVAVAASTTGGHPLPAARAHSGGQRGPQGPRGPRGFRGPRGKSGYCKGCTATGATGAQGAAGPKGATGATGATGAAGPAGAANPDATDSAALGGVPAAGFVQNACGVVDGAVKGFVSVPANGNFSSTFTAMSGYNCSGQAVDARRVATGVYDVQFLGSPVTVAVGNVLLPSIDYNSTSQNTGSLSIAQEGPGEFRVVIESSQQANTVLDLPFDLVTP